MMPEPGTNQLVGVYRRRYRIRVAPLPWSGWGLLANVSSIALALVLVHISLAPRMHWWWTDLRYRAVIYVGALLGLTVIVFVHEIAHAWLLASRGPVRVLVSPTFGAAIAETERPQVGAIVAGPAASIVLGLTMQLLVNALIGPLPYSVVRLVWWVGEISLLAGLTNLLPVFPLDGYRLLEALTDRAPSARVRQGTQWVLALVSTVVAGSLVVFTALVGAWVGVAAGGAMLLLGLAPLVDLVVSSRRPGGRAERGPLSPDVEGR